VIYILNTLYVLANIVNNSLAHIFYMNQLSSPLKTSPLKRHAFLDHIKPFNFWPNRQK